MSVIQPRNTVSDFVLDRLMEWGVDTVFGYPGDGIGAFDGALARADHDDLPLRYIRPTHEEICGLMATAYAKWTGRLGVCTATSSPGAFHMLNGLYDAKMDNQPVVAVIGQQNLASLGSGYQQESNLERTFADVGAYVQTIVTPEQAQVVVDRACRTALTHRQPCVIVIPHDVQAMTREEPPQRMEVSRSSSAPTSTAIAPPSDELRRAADVLNAGKKVAFLVGAGALGATDEVLALAEKTGAGITTALRGKDVVPGDVPYNTEQLGLLGTLPSYKMMQECDTLLMIGSNYPYGGYLPATGQARGVQIDLRPSQLGVRYPMEVTLWGDAKTTLQALLPLVEQTADTSFQDTTAERMREWEGVLAALAQNEAEPINPRQVFHEMNERLPAGAVVTCDAGSTADWYGHHVRLKRGMRGDLSGRLATMLAAMPYAVAAKFALPGRPVVCTIGDGAFQMLGMNELITVKKYQHLWENKQLVVLVLHNDDLTQVSWEMRTEDGNPRWTGSQAVESVDYAAFAETLGFQGLKVTDPSKVGEAWDAAFAYDGVTVLDVHTDKNVPPLPPHISFKFAANMAEALLKGDPDEWDVVKSSAKALVTQKAAEVKEALHLGDDDDA
ncbi:thiamine pyrophosphate-requiring protein [Rubrivirga sp. S365]|uniref:thiamine pyrophosphate-requiring protein n=1 Tax=Rubrivirga sp. S365 TaxID=3076080 RepID=UPI0028C54139|nr:thiamine pyrophosphate-requiring protein [Rubrivirga sp. S365]MDT7857294.1 thiamine pyrophosphate-requiring protein [Rubrivirga sp. S365]